MRQEDTDPDVAKRAEEARSFFDGVWRSDQWALDTDPFEAAKYQRQLELIGDRRYERVLEVGCGSGVFTRLLGRLAKRVVALDVSAAAIERARAAGDVGGAIDYRVASAIGYEPQADCPFDLVVMSETIYYIGWLYTFFQVSWLAAELFDATADGGRFLMTNTYSVGHTSWLHRPLQVHTYRDLFRNAGYRLALEEPFTGEKEGVPQRSLICLFEKPPGSPPATV
jgi:SAM-dependent methyltransferase